MIDKIKHAIIFGANGDLGSAFAKILIPNSHKVTLVARDIEKVNHIFLDDKKTEFLQYSFPEDTSKLSDYINSLTQPIDFCVNAIGSYSKTEDILNKKHFEQVIDSNFSVLQNILKEISPQICSRGKFINISSIASHSGSSDENAYASSKILVDKLMSSLRFTDTFSKVKTLNVRPGAIKSKMTLGRANSEFFIDPDELAELCINTICHGSSLTVPTIDVFRSN
tara:strand:+ start:494 stop:1165 length:672 start_codon:yes stop_codon:yes gene_type:complete